MFFSGFTKYKNSSAENKEQSISSFLPYSSHYDENVVLTKNMEMMCVVKIDGFSFETADDELLEMKKFSRNNLIKGMADPNFIIYHTLIRKNYRGFPGGTFEDGSFGAFLNDEWRLKHDPDNTFINEHYITIIRKPSSKISGILSMANFLKGSSDDAEENQNNAMTELASQVKEIADRVLNGFASYGAKLLGIRREKNGNYSELSEFFAQIVNCSSNDKVLMPRNKIADVIPNVRLFFSDKSIEIVGSDYRKYAGMVSVKEYRPATYSGMLDGFLQLPFEFVLTQSFQFIDRTTAISKMQLQQRRLIQSEDVAVSQIQEINDALDSAMGGEFAFGVHHMTVMPITKTLQALDTALSQVIVEFANCGISSVKERLNMEPSYWSQYPGNVSFAVRRSTVNSLNFASFCSLHNFPFGKVKGNFWGDAVTVFNTTSGTPYFFSFHSRDVGHSFIIGPTGSGKTVLLNFLCGQAQKFRPRTFFFDKDRGAEIFLKSIGGNYTIIDPGRPCNFNPLQLADTAENRNFLEEWLAVMVSVNKEIVGADDRLLIQAAIDGNYKLAKSDRKLSNIAPFLGIEKPGSLAGRLRMWHTGGSKSKVFDNEVDNVDFSKGSVFGFEMAELLKDPIILSPVLLYIFHKINSSLDGTKTMLILDEAWALIDNPVFAPKIKDWLKVLRKLNAFVVFATQSVEDAAKSQISDTLVQQTSCQIFLPNLKATDAYKDVFMLSQREFEIVKTTDPSSRYFLIKQDNDGVVAKLDLAGMGDVINIISGRIETVLLLDEIVEDYGSDPYEWLPIFIKRTRDL